MITDTMYKVITQVFNNKRKVIHSCDIYIKKEDNFFDGLYHIGAKFYNKDEKGITFTAKVAGHLFVFLLVIPKVVYTVKAGTYGALSVKEIENVA